MPASSESFALRVIALCGLRGAPQDLPHSHALLGALLVATTVVDVCIASVLGEADGAFAHSLLLSAIVLCLSGAALAIRRMPHRFVQTAIALLAAGTVISLVQLPIAWIAGPPPPAQATLDTMQAVFRWLALAVLVWQLAVFAHIMRHALESSFAFALMLVSTWLIAFWALDGALLGHAVG